MVHLRNALKYSDSEELKNFEMHIYEELDSLIENKTIDHDEMKKKLDHLLEELDYIVEEKDTGNAALIRADLGLRLPRIQHQTVKS